jgi:hypothetical protein
MKKFIAFVAVAILSLGSALGATDVINQDNKSYTVKVQGEGNLSISEHKVGSGGSLYGLCGYSFCTFEIGSDKISATKDERLTIRNGKFSK